MKTYFPLFCLLTLTLSGCLKTIDDRDVVSGEMAGEERDPDDASTIMEGNTGVINYNGDLEEEFPTCVEDEFQGSLYLYCPRTFGMPIWMSAEMYCNDWGGHLATINSYDEFEWLTHMGPQIDGSANWWIGFNDRSAEGEWTWIDGSPDDYHPGWHPSSPDDDERIDCAFMGRDGDGWRRDGCLASHTFICEK